jgi:DNA-binding Lrp family transcriptional regulator
VVLGELRKAGRKSIAELARELESCGMSPTDVKAVVDRLCEAQLVEPLPAAAAAA